MKCIPQQFPISKLWVQKNVIDESPEYQRESAVWSLEKRQLFIDSILNQFDVPKLYFHDLNTTGENPVMEYAVVDGKQRLNAIWSFMKDEFALAEDFTIFSSQKNAPPLAPGSKYSQMDDYWKEHFKGTALAVVLIQYATDEDIEELFSRLNNGEPLNAAEKRNAMGGDMCKLIREIAKHKFFTDRLRVKNNRFQHYEIAAKFLLIEHTQATTGAEHCDLKKKFLDELVKKNKVLSKAEQEGLSRRVNDTLNLMHKIFSVDKDTLLAKQAYAPLYYLFVKRLAQTYGHQKLNSLVKPFLENFQAARLRNLDLPEDERDSVLIEFGRLMQQGTNDLGSLKYREGVLIRYFLLENPDVEIKDAKRTFNDEERSAIWVLGGKKCAECGVTISIDEMHADHVNQWSFGGKTTLANSRCLCISCNTKLAVKKS